MLVSFVFSFFLIPFKILWCVDIIWTACSTHDTNERWQQGDHNCQLWKDQCRLHSHERSQDRTFQIGRIIVVVGNQLELIIFIL